MSTPRRPRAGHPRTRGCPPGAAAAPAPGGARRVVRAVEEAAFTPTRPARGRAARLARAGAVGSITVERGGAVAAVEDGDDAYTVTVTVPGARRPPTRRRSPSSSPPSRAGSRPCSPATCRTRSSRRVRGGRRRAAALRRRAGLGLHLRGVAGPVPPRAGRADPAGVADRGGPVRAHPPPRAVPRPGAARPPPDHHAARPRGRQGRRWRERGRGPDEVDDLVVAEDAAVRAARLLQQDAAVRVVVREGQRASVVAAGRAPSSSSRRSRPGPSSLIILTWATISLTVDSSSICSSRNQLSSGRESRSPSDSARR